MENTFWRISAIAGCLDKVRKQLGYSALTTHQQQAILELCSRQRNAFMSMRYVYSLRAFCNLIGATGESCNSDPAQNVICVMPDPPSMGGGAGKPDWHGSCW